MKISILKTAMVSAAIMTICASSAYAAAAGGVIPFTAQDVANYVPHDTAHDKPFLQSAEGQAAIQSVIDEINANPKAAGAMGLVTAHLGAPNNKAIIARAAMQRAHKPSPEHERLLSQDKMDAAARTAALLEEEPDDETARLLKNHQKKKSAPADTSKS